jgi:PKD repeat protein
VRATTSPLDPASKIAIERLKLIFAMVARDLGQIYRHGIVALVVLTFILLFLGIFLFNSTADQIEERGTETWTDPIIPGDEGGDEFLSAEVTPDVYSGASPLTVTFTPVVTSSEGEVSYRWEFGDGESSGNAGEATHTYSNPGIYPCFLEVTDDRDEPVSSSMVSVLVFDAGDPNLQSTMSFNRTEGTPPLDVAFRSTVVGGMPPYTYDWNFGDGNSSQDPQPTHAFEEPGERVVSLTVTDSEGNVTGPLEMTINVSEEEGGEGLPFTLLDALFGFSVIVTMVIIPVAFSTGFRHEMSRGTVRTIVVYPLGVLEVVLAKLLYAAIVGLILSAFIVLLPSGALGMPGGQVFSIFFTAYLLTLVTVTIGALAALSVARLRKKMTFRPTSLPFLFVALSFMGTNMILAGIGTFLKVLGTGIDPDSLVDTFAPLITLSPYHMGGETLYTSLSGTGTAPLWVLIVPTLLIIVGWIMARGVYPDVFEKE